MNAATTDLPETLSSILCSMPRFGTLQNTPKLPEPGTTPLSHQDISHVNMLIDNIHSQLSALKTMYDSRIVHADTYQMDWFYDGKSAILDLIEDTDQIDLLISHILSLIDSPEFPLDPDDLSNLLSKLEDTSDLQLEVKRVLILLKKKIDISINYREINDLVIKSLRDEILLCVECFHKISEMKLSSPHRHLPKFDLAEITAKMKIDNLSSAHNFSAKSLRLPTFNDFDESLYNDYLMLESRVKPLKVSLEFLPMKIEEFHQLSRSIFPHASIQIQSSYDDLSNTWNYLQLELGNLKRESLDKKWNEIFRYLIVEISHQCETLNKDLISGKRPSKILLSPENRSNSTDDNNQETDSDSDDVMDFIGPTYKLCSNCITMINKAFAEGTITDSKLVSLFNENLLPKWNVLNDTLLKIPKQSPSSQSRASASIIEKDDGPSLDENGLRPLRTVQRWSSTSSKSISSPPETADVDYQLTTIDESQEHENARTPTKKEAPAQAFTKLRRNSRLSTGDSILKVNTSGGSAPPKKSPSVVISPNGYGIDLRLSIDQTSSKTTPFSIEQKDKVKDFLSGEVNDKDGGSNLTAEQQHEFIEMKRKNLKHSLMRLNGGTDINDDEEDDEEATLVHATPKLGLDYDDEGSFSNNTKYSKASLSRESSQLNKQALLQFLTSNASERPTRLPVIIENYRSLGLPIIKKRLIDPSRPTRIPSISPNHPVFHSPKRQDPGCGKVRSSGNKLDHAARLKPPLYALKRNSLLKFPLGDLSNMMSDNRINNGSSNNYTIPKSKQAGDQLKPRNKFVSKSPAYTGATAVEGNTRSSIRLSGVSLTGMSTPNLKFGASLRSPSNISPSSSVKSAASPTGSSRPMSPIRSTSPERPNSSIGSRFDEIHLVQPLKHKQKQVWK